MLVFSSQRSRSKILHNHNSRNIWNPHAKHGRQGPYLEHSTGQENPVIHGFFLLRSSFKWSSIFFFFLLLVVGFCWLTGWLINWLIDFPNRNNSNNCKKCVPHSYTIIQTTEASSEAGVRWNLQGVPWSYQVQLHLSSHSQPSFPKFYLTDSIIRQKKIIPSKCFISTLTQLNQAIFYKKADDACLIV